MIELDNYIVEKLKLNKDIKDINTYTITKEDEEKVKDIFNSTSRYSVGYDRERCKNLANKCLSANSCIKKWVTIMIMTNSVPYIYKNTVISLPGNFGSYFVDRGIDQYNAKAQDFINAYELAKPEELHDLPTKLAAEYYDVIETLLDVIIKNQKYRIEFNYTDYDSYSKEALEIMKERNGKIALPFEVTYKNKSAKCEIIFIIGGTYYNYRVNDKNFKWSQQFIDELKNELGA